MTACCGLGSMLMGLPAAGNIPKWFASLVAGQPIVKTMLHQDRTRPTLSALPGFKLIYPSYREGLPATLQALRLTVSTRDLTPLPSAGSSG